MGLLPIRRLHEYRLLSKRWGLSVGAFISLLRLLRWGGEGLSVGSLPIKRLLHWDRLLRKGQGRSGGRLLLLTQQVKGNGGTRLQRLLGKGTLPGELGRGRKGRLLCNSLLLGLVVPLAGVPLHFDGPQQLALFA